MKMSNNVGLLVALCIFIPSIDGIHPVEITDASTRPQVSGAYNISDKTTTLLGSDYYAGLADACNTNFDPSECSRKLDQAETTLKLLFDTSDLDNYLIYQRLFTKHAGGESLSNHLSELNRDALFSNETIFGKNQSGTVNPGLMRDLTIISDGVKQLQSIARGQKQSVSGSQKKQSTAVKAYASKVKQSASEVASQLTGLMKNLVRARTHVQRSYFRSMWDSVNSTLMDIGSQSDEFLKDSQDQLYSLSQRYNDWTEATSDEIAAAKTRTQNSLIGMKTLVKSMIPSIKTRWKSERLTQIDAVLKDTVDELERDIAKVQNTIAVRFGKDADFFATKITNSHDDFAYNVTTFQEDVQDKLTALAGRILPDTDDYGRPTGDGLLIDTTERDARENLRVRIRAIADTLKSLIVPLVKDVQGKLGESKTMNDQISAFQAQVLNDTETILGTSQKDVSGLSQQVSAAVVKTRSNFNESMDGVTSGTSAKIRSKVDSAKSQLGTIFANIQDHASETASGQSLQGSTATDAAGLSDTAAQLTAARQQLVADSASARLQTGVGVVSASLADATATSDEINRSNQNMVFTAQAQASASQQTLMEKAHEQLLAQSASSRSAQQALQTSFFQSQLAGQDLSSSMQQDGRYLEEQLRQQSLQSNQAVDGASGVLNVAQQGGSALLNRMQSFESTAQTSVDSFLSRMSAFQNQAQQQGQTAMLAATNSAGTQATNLLSNLGSTLGRVISTQPKPVESPSLSQDQMSLSQDVSVGPARINAQAAAAQNLVTAKANNAMIQSVQSLQSTSSDSQAALTELMNYNADLIDSKRSIVLSTGGSAVNASLEAAEYLTDSGNNYMDIHQRFMNDVQSLGSQGALNQTKVLARLNDTLADITGIVGRFMDKLDGPVANATAQLPLDVKSDSVNVIAAIAAKINATNAAILAAANGSIDTASLLSTAKNLNAYIDSLKSSFEKQRASFNKYAQQIAVRRIAALTGLSESVIAQKVSILQSLAQSDASEGDTATRTTTMLQSLQKAIETAKDQSGDTTKVTSLINSIGSGMNSFTNNLRNQVEGNSGSLAQKTNSATINVGKTLGNLAYNAATSAGSIGDSLLAAIDTVQQSTLVANLTAYGGQKDVFAIAGMLKTLDQASQQKIAQLFSQLQSGNMSMSQAIDAAQELQKTEISSLYDVLQSLTPYVAGHEAMVNSFLGNLNASTSAVASSVKDAVSDHEAIEGDIILDIASNGGLLTELGANLPQTLNDTETMVLNKTRALENLLDSTIFAGTKDGFSDADSSQFDGTGGWVSMLLSPSSSSSSSLSQIKLHDQQPSSGIPSRVVNLKEALVEGQIGVSREKNRFVSEIDKDLQAGNNVLKQIIDTVRSTMLLV